MPRPLVRKVKGTIVVAHDDHTVVMLVSELLRKHGFQAVSAPEPAASVALAS